MRARLDSTPTQRRVTPANAETTAPSAGIPAPVLARTPESAPADAAKVAGTSLASAAKVTARDLGGRRAASASGPLFMQHGLGAAPAERPAPKLQGLVLASLDRLLDATPEWLGVIRAGLAGGQLRLVATDDRGSLDGLRLLPNGLLVDFAASRVLGRVVDEAGQQQALGPAMKMIWGWFKSSQDDYLDEDHVEELAGRYRDGDPWIEPAEVKSDGTIQDGHHRLEAQKRAGVDPDFVVVDDDDKIIGTSTGETERGKPWWR